jgi:hypothetical protein
MRFVATICGAEQEGTDRLRERSFKLVRRVSTPMDCVCCAHRPSETKVTRVPGCGRAPPFPE